MSQHKSAGVQQKKVRPRLAWGGTALAVLGIVGIGVAMAQHAGVWLWVAVAVTVVGLLLAWRGGVVYDVHAVMPADEDLREAVQGGEHPGISPEQRVPDPRARETAAVTAQQTRALEQAQIAYRPPLGPLGSIVLMVLGAWLMISPGALVYPYDAAGQASAVRDQGFGLVFFLAGLYLHQMGPSRVASGLCLVCAILLVLSGTFLPHGSGVVRLNEIVVGIASLIASVVTFEPELVGAADRSSGHGRSHS